MTRKGSSGKPSRAGAYEVLEMIGEGGMSTVYKGRDPATGQLVAIKVLAPQAAANALMMERFKQEYRTARSLTHSHLVQGLDFGLEDGVPYLVMELVEGEDLAARIARQGKLPEDEAVRLIRQVAQALQLVHDNQIIHRDVKPSNILLTHDGQAKLADLGLVKDYQSGVDLTRPLVGMGTPNYMAPEQFGDAKHATARCDIYSLGATLYTAVTGEVPFQARTPLHILNKKLKNDFTPPRELTPRLSRPVDYAIRRAMRADAGQRQASCRELADSLTQLPPEPASGLPCATGPAPSAPAKGARPREAERRALVRYPSPAEASCWPVTEAGKKAVLVSRVQNISDTGVCLRLSRRFEPGTLLGLELCSKGPCATRFVLVRVQWAKRGPGKTWRIGCAFERSLLDFEIAAWL
jgi:serine/threonine protein kinase